MKVLNNVKDTKHFCILPWIHFHAWPDKRVMPCCIADAYNPVSTTDRGEILDIMNSERYNEIRVQMLNDEYIPECKRCYDLESWGIHSLRNANNNQRYEQSKHLIESTNEDGSLNKFEMKYLDIRFSNLCNMKCRTCGPECSSRWAEEFTQLYNKKTYEQSYKTKKIVVSNNENDVLMKKIQPHLLQVEEVYFAGGESLITDEHYDILDYWVEKDHFNVGLNYTTNFLTLRFKDKHAVDYWKKFSDIQIWASLDGMGPTLELMRHGAHWDTMLENIKLVKKEVPHARFGITPTISLWNIFHFPDFHKFMLNNKLIEMHNLRMNILTYPSHMSIKHLPPFLVERALKLWWNHYHWITDNHPRGDFRLEDYSEQIITVCNALEEAVENRDEISKFFDVEAKISPLRNENPFEVIPYLKELKAWLDS